jgi:hypothetical protein
MSIAGTIVASGKLMRGYAESLSQGIDGPQFARKPTWGLGGQEIDTNHAAFCYGHLAIYPARILTLLGKDPAPAAAPIAFEPLFKAGAPCIDDPHGTIYPAMSVVLEAFGRAYDVALTEVARASDAQLLKETPNESHRKNFPTIGALSNFLLGAHVAVHIGQVSAWRRCMGLPGVM